MERFILLDQIDCIFFFCSKQPIELISSFMLFVNDICAIFIGNFHPNIDHKEFGKELLLVYCPKWPINLYFISNCLIRNFILIRSCNILFALEGCLFFSSERRFNFCFPSNLNREEKSQITFHQVFKGENKWFSRVIPDHNNRSLSRYA